MKVRGQISLYSGGTIVFGLSDYPVSEFELVAEELLMSDSIIKVYDSCIFVLFLFVILSLIIGGADF